jgi:dihydrodiol dehydrogenase / D-xylose 1-dehydrogenase (NADP)
MAKARWGIMGTGLIANSFAEALAFVPEAELAAVASRAQESADAFGEKWDVPRRHGTYEALAADADVDVVYVATPHPFHRDNTVMCLEAGTPVLCEKPLAINAGQEEEMITCARAHRLFLMEAMWVRYVPAIARMRQLIGSGEIGEPRLLTCDFCIRLDFDPANRMWNPDLAGGALLDLGVYGVNLAFMVFGRPPVRVLSSALIGETGVDEIDSLILEYDNGSQATITCATRANMHHEVVVCGTEKHIRVHHPFYKASRLSIGDWPDSADVIETPMEGNGLNYEAAEAGRCLGAGLLESDVMPLDESVAVMRVLDGIRAEWGIRYPME